MTDVQDETLSNREDVICAAVINRRYETLDEAWGYLAARGFACSADGWHNGRWLAAVGRDGLGYRVRAWLPAEPDAELDAELGAALDA